MGGESPPCTGASMAREPTLKVPQATNDDFSFCHFYGELGVSVYLIGSEANV